MDFGKFKSAIETIAPWLAGTLGTPVMGVAVQALETVFGLQPVTATPQNLLTALAGATPQQLQDLRTADQKHQEFMQQIGFDNLDKLAEASVEDRNGARRREEVVKDNTPAVLSAIAVIGFVLIVMMVATGYEPKQSMQAGFWMLVGAEIAILKDVYGYYFGSSKGSQDKDATIAAQAGVTHE